LWRIWYFFALCMKFINTWQCLRIAKTKHPFNMWVECSSYQCSQTGTVESISKIVLRGNGFHVNVGILSTEILFKQKILFRSSKSLVLALVRDHLVSLLCSDEADLSTSFSGFQAVTTRDAFYVFKISLLIEIVSYAFLVTMKHWHLLASKKNYNCFCLQILTSAPKTFSFATWERFALTRLAATRAHATTVCKEMEGHALVSIVRSTVFSQT